MKVPILKIPFDRDDTTEICRELTDLLLSGRLAMGQKVREFETKFQQFVGSAYALGTSNGTTALEVIFRSLSDFISQGQNQSQPPDRSQAFGRSQPPGQTQWSVAVPSNTFMASCLAPIAAGFKIILIDCDPVYFQMCPEDLARKIQPTTRAVLLVHNGGFISPDWTQIKSIAEKNNSVLIEDAAHAHGAEIDGRQAGTLGLAGAFSFYPTKVLTTAEGGMVVTSDQK
ncbi:MAG: DegT/DnrJ/EryC1/StrS family aminotransferase, partial [Deltaproteobacteria bacterium]|nr:DegT/DnrJ/EryC1/StrS family aminotransferase [Deltaproteobacteria bacterium]